MYFVSAFLVYFCSGLILVGVATAVFVQLTPFPEMQLIRQGNMAAAWVFVGALLGFTFPVASAIAHSVSFTDMLVWTLAGLLFQYLAHLAIRRFIPGFVQGIGDGVASLGVLSAGLSVAVGLINAASLAY